MEKNFIAFLCSGLLIVTQSTKAQDSTAKSAQEIAKELANPTANLISVPFQSNLDVGVGVNNGSKLVTNIQPVIPFTLSPKWTLITRLVLPVISQFDIAGNSSQQFGLGDVAISGFFSPANSKIIWGIGPAFILPTATDARLGGKKWAAGPTVVVAKQAGPWTLGALANHVFSFAGNKNRSDISATFFNPFLSYNWKSGAGVTLPVEYTHEWKSNLDVLVITPVLTTVTKFGNQTTSFSIGPRLHLAPSTHPAYGLRAGITLVFPK